MASNILLVEDDAMDAKRCDLAILDMKFRDGF